MATALSPPLQQLEKACRLTPVLCPIAARLAALVEDLANPPMVAVFGSFNAGKSTLINALLDQEIVKTSVVPANARVILLQYSDKPTLVGFTANGEKRTYDPTLLHSIAFEGDEGFEHVRRDLSYLVYGYPHDLLREMVLIDTPGLNATFEDHALSTADILSRVDVFVLVTRFMGAGNAGEIEFLRKLGRVVDLLVINRIDAAHEEEGPIDAHLSQMARKYGALISEYVGVSARDAVLARKSSDGALLSKSRWEDFAHTFERVFRTRAQGRKSTNALRQLKGTLREAAAAIDELANETGTNLKTGYASRKTAGESRLAAVSLLRTWKAKKSQSWAERPVELSGIPKTLRERIQVLTLEFSGLRAEMHTNQAEIVECRSEQVRLERRVRRSCDAMTAYNETGLFSRLWDGLFGETSERLNREEVDANSAASRNRERGVALDEVKSSFSVQERTLNAKEKTVAQDIADTLASEYISANVVLRKSRGRLRKVRWALAIRPDLFDAMQSALEPVIRVESTIVDDLEQEWTLRDANAEMASVVGEAGELRKSITRMVSHNYLYSTRTLLRLRKGLAHFLRESRTKHIATVFAGIDDALCYFPASELSDVINRLTSVTQADRFAKALCGLAAGHADSYEYLAKCVRNVNGLDNILMFARKNAPGALDEVLHNVSLINPGMSREVYLRSGPHSRARLVSMTTIASELLTFLPEDITVATGVMA